MSDSLQRNTPDSIQRGQNGFEFIPNYVYDREDNESNGLDPKKIIAILFRYKWIILLFLFAGATSAWFYAKSLPPTFESSGTMLISSTDASTDEGLSNIIAKTTGYGTSSTLENELQILQSRSFSHQVARKVIDENPGGISQFPVLWTYDEETDEIYKANEATVASRIRRNLSFAQPEEKSDVIEISFKSESPEEAAKIVNEAMKIYVENSTQQNRQAASSTADFLEKEKEEIKGKLDESEERLRQYMDNSGIVQVNEQATGMVNRRAETEAELQRVNLELGTIKQSVANYENQLEKIRPGLTDQFSEAIGPRIQASQEELARYENEKMQIIAKNPNALKMQPPPARLQFIDEQIGRLKEEIKNLSSKLFTDENQFVGLDGAAQAQNVTDIQTRLVELRIEQNQLQSRQEALQQLKQQMDSNFDSLPEGMIQLAKLQRDVRINEELYLNVSRQYADMSVWEQSQFGFGRIIDKGIKPNGPVSPNKKILLLLGIMLGGVLAAGFIAVKEFMDNSVKGVDQIRNKLLPSLSFSAIPTIEKVHKKNKKSFTIGMGIIPDEIVMLNDPSSIASESFRRLKNNVIYQHGDAPPKTIAVTSPEKGDGKSTIVANLGIAFAEERYKTLLVGADFRRPKLQKYFGLTDLDGGLSDYLDGNLSFQETLMTIQNTELNSLKVIPTGNKTNKPEGLGNVKAFNRFLERMEEVFDVIIIDTPPFGIISDSTAILKGADATLVVARHRKTNSGMLLRTIEELGRIHANVTGIVLNDFDHKKEPYGAGYYETLYGNYEAYVK